MGIMVKKAIKKSAKIILAFISIILIVLIIMALYHHVRLVMDKTKIAEQGTLIDVDGHQMNIYTEGERKSPDDPTIVLLSGSGVAAPVYDYKVLYSKLSGNYRVAVIEKFGYGYSDVSGISRDVATMVEESREILSKAGESAPYVLMPHSMSALEAIYWAHTYPDEVQAIVGLDMAVPQSYVEDNINSITFMKIGIFFGFHRFDIFNPVTSLGLTDKEYEQNRLLNYRNSLNQDVYNECKIVLENAETVHNMDISNIPMLMFTTTLGGSTDRESWTDAQQQWVAAQEDFASTMNNCTQIVFETGHNLHYYKSDEMAETILPFLDGLNKVS
jgi:pimeloyl-ACP methyl ester carboxylesterase